MIRLTTVLSILILGLGAQALAQTSTDENIIRWKEGAAHSDKFTIQGKLYKTITLDGVTVFASVNKEKLGAGNAVYEKSVASVGVINRGERRIELDPNAFSLQVLKPKPRVLVRETADHLSKSVEFWTAFGGAMGQVGANQKTVQSTSTGYESGTVSSPGYGSVTYSGTTTTTTTSPDLEARRRADQKAADMNRDAQIAGGNLRALELKANTLTPGQEAGGILIFDRDKKCEEIVLQVPINGKTLEVPFTCTWLRK